MSRNEILRAFAPHLAALTLPLLAAGYLASAPHSGLLALIVFGSTALTLQLADRYGGTHTHQPRPDLPHWPFDALLYALVAIQLANVALLVRYFTVQDFWTADTLVAILLTGGSSGFSAIVVAHELIHRASSKMRLMGRILLCTVVYEHFYTEHIRGHHVRVGTPQDPATARFDESFATFYLRTVPAQFRSAWRLETARLGDEDMNLLDPRQLQNQVLRGLVAEWSFALAILALAGGAALCGFLLQAVFASRALETVNYFEHWGLLRSGKRARTVDSWDTHSRFTYYSLTGLTRHADHHAYAARPYEQLRVHSEAPVLPRGYIAMFPLVMARNREFRRLMTAELQRRRLGPFAVAAEEPGYDE